MFTFFKIAKDFIFEAVFNNPKDKMPLAHLLSDYLGEEYDHLLNNIKILPRKVIPKKEKNAYKLDKTQHARQINFCLKVPEIFKTDNLIAEAFLIIKGINIIITDLLEINIVDM